MIKWVLSILGFKVYNYWVEWEYEKNGKKIRKGEWVKTNIKFNVDNWKFLKETFASKYDVKEYIFIQSINKLD